MGKLVTGEEEESVMAAFSPFLSLICTSEDSLVRAVLRGGKRGSSAGTSCYIPFLWRNDIWTATEVVPCS